MQAPHIEKEILILRQGNVPERWIAEAKRRIKNHPTTTLANNQSSPDAVVLFTSKHIYSEGQFRADTLQLLRSYPQSVLLVISPDQIEPSIRLQEVLDEEQLKPKNAHLPYSGNSALEVIQALIDMHVIPQPHLDL